MTNQTFALITIMPTPEMSEELDEMTEELDGTHDLLSLSIS